MTSKTQNRAEAICELEFDPDTGQAYMVCVDGPDREQAMTPTPEAQPSVLREDALEKIDAVLRAHHGSSITEALMSARAALSAPVAPGEWRSLETDPPKGDGEVVLFPTISDVGILYTASNPAYARVNALKNGYTHWFRIPPHPQEAEMKARCAAIEPYDGSPLPEPPPSAREAALEAALREARRYLIIPEGPYGTMQELAARIDALLEGSKT